LSSVTEGYKTKDAVNSGEGLLIYVHFLVKEEGDTGCKLLKKILSRNLENINISS
jgi:hypothetical protein